MANYKYSQNLDGNNDNILVEYNVTPEFGSTVKVGDTVIATGRIRDRRKALKKLKCQIGIVDGSWYEPAGELEKKKVVAEDTWGKFSFAVTIDNDTFLNDRVEKLSIVFDFTEEDGSSAALTAKSNDQFYYWYQWHVNPELTCEGGFQRCEYDGKVSENGEYVRCDGLKLSMDSRADSSYIRSVSVKATNITSPSITNSDTMTQSQISSMCSSSGYSGVLSQNMQLTSASSYWLDITISDGYESVSQRFELSAASVILCFSLKEKGGLAVGKYSDSTNSVAMFEVAGNYESYFYGGINGINVYKRGGGIYPNQHSTYGRWIDNKTIYRYTYDGTLPAQNQIVVSDFGSGTLDTVVSMQGMAHRNDGQWIPIPYTRENGNVFNIYINTADGAVGVNCTDTSGGGYDRMILIVDYTLK